MCVFGRFDDGHDMKTRSSIIMREKVIGQISQLNSAKRLLNISVSYVQKDVMMLCSYRPVYFVSLVAWMVF